MQRGPRDTGLMAKIATAALGELKKLANGLGGEGGFAARPSSGMIPNMVAKRNKLPALPTLHRGGLNANTDLGPNGGGIGGGGSTPGSLSYGMKINGKG